MGTTTRQKAYRAFLNSPYWAEVRRRVWRRDKICQNCGLDFSKEWWVSGHVHHVTYHLPDGSRVIGHELDHLHVCELLCEYCHFEQHFGVKQKRR
jgi:5-methylcytosine-specific restriction endonuclease McrA